MLVKITAIIQKEEDWYVAKCVENNVASQGKTIEDAISNLTEAVQLYYEDDDAIIENHQTLITTLEVAI
ncbi:type II toxin-antitoxin system HicB family antitoxin [Fusibacter ferrireducens]|uniref:Type II toxin-antitoxin system HicB family antitoxin n=1 Tax=Fusibacter ferrireducens TaxID=2785058 RepID=A0ABS0A036_9FIRM|nr:type II toxin-antitoxin system HicB family antitoxin [Fusibacter ferrireducens]MBF4696067.1 type II toxin-antitoxin system HicB family antitoxin [Fusibacter ferrireducens]